MPIFTPKERRAHYAGVANGTVAVKPNSKFSEEEQRAYAKGQTDARNEQAVAVMLGKNSPLSEAEKMQLKEENRAIREAHIAGDKKRAEQLKQNKRNRIAMARANRRKK